ncbi:efflux RND transporter periplasmic adaptor subunit [Jannaschia ovalis]|uniref:Efflux RND transporter periplasmic adaptor subunit n=1 Tax=Jannaschia ovalis TaxID=3038773 RepID=A0ABY8L936_9RHOB|nr:efflux RND transporter periplasmic adaptor subunit [Jannaschia sp. GRR-S6-38]WGH77875.1 efflux RND transporter periplasmic adaptor subunit [Jannaschia sp. GRR-S6-38]
MKPAFAFLILILPVLGCREDAPTPETPVRGMKSFLVEEPARVATRRFPAVLEPPELTVLSFETGGRLEEIDLSIGQRVTRGEVIARLDPTTLELQVASAEAALNEARANATNARDTLARQLALLESGTVTRVVVEEAQLQADAADAQLVRAEKSLETAREALTAAELVAPFDGIINAVEVASFATVGVGSPVVTIYPADGFEVSFSVSFDVVGQLVVGTPARVRLADRPGLVLGAFVSEIGSRADAVSSFPVVLELRESDPVLKAGMAVEAAIDLPAPVREGYPLPLSAVIRDGHAGPDGGRMGVYVYDPNTSTVQRRDVTVNGIRENRVVVLDGLVPGDRVAAAGVSFLRDGQEVRLLGPGE